MNPLTTPPTSLGLRETNPIDPPSMEETSAARPEGRGVSHEYHRELDALRSRGGEKSGGIRRTAVNEGECRWADRLWSRGGSGETGRGRRERSRRWGGRGRRCGRDGGGGSGGGSGSSGSGKSRT